MVNPLHRRLLAAADPPPPAAPAPAARSAPVPVYRKQMEGPPPATPVYWLKTHGGLGDIVWLAKKFVNLPYPVFLSISSEGRSRPRRSGYLADHLPNVLGWRFDDDAFCPNGQDWPDPADPACMIGKTWDELDVPLNVPVRVECNRWLEGGRRLEGWLPDLATTHHFEFEPCAPSAREFARPSVVFHIAGWPDVPDAVWATLVDLFRPLAHCYLVGGSYDRRPAAVFNLVGRGGGVTLLEDVPWADLIGVLGACDYAFGHASGFTALADVLRVRGAVFNPRSVPRLVGTWNDAEHADQVHLDRVDEFQNAVFAAFQTVSCGDRSTWPPTSRRGGRLTARGGDALAAVRAAAGFGPRRAAVWVAEAVAVDAALPAAVLAGAYARGRAVDSLYLVGCTPEALAAALKEGARSTRRPVVDVGEPPWPGRRRGDPFDLIVVLPPEDQPVATRMIRDAWRTLNAPGTLLVGGGPVAHAGFAALAAGLSVRPADVQDSEGWHYLHRRA